MNPAFPATYSTLCPKALASFISEKYNLEMRDARSWFVW